jgi:hypothetical protein
MEVHICDIVSLKDNTVEPKTIFLLQCPVHLTNDLLVILGGKGNILESGNCISTCKSNALDLRAFNPKFDREHIPSIGNPYV